MKGLGGIIQRKRKLLGKPKVQKETESIYRRSRKDKMLLLGKGVIIVLVIGFLCYQSIGGSILISPYLWFYTKKEKKHWLLKQQQQYHLQFKDALISMSAALSAGYSIENSIREARNDLVCMYQKDEIICKEFERMMVQLNMNVPIEQVFFEFGKRSQLEDIKNFAWVFATAKRTGGDLIKIMKHTSHIISQKILVEQEIATLVSAKKYEATIMKVIPFGIILYLNLSSPGFLDPLYHNVVGIVTMTTLLIIYLVAVLWTEKILKIKV